MHFVTRGVAIQFFQPEFAPVCWRGAILASFVAMPEAAVDENDCFVFRQNNIRFAGQRFDVQPKAVTHPMQQAPDDQLRGSIFPADAAHVPGAASFGQAIAHLFSVELRVQIAKWGKSTGRRKAVSGLLLQGLWAKTQS